MKTISESLDRASHHQLKVVLESILTAFTENQVEALRKDDIKDILMDEGLSIPGIYDLIPLSDREAIRDALEKTFPRKDEALDLLTNIIQECGQAPICPKDLPGILEDYGIYINWMA